jgi:hypothetical protein
MPPLDHRERFSRKSAVVARIWAGGAVELRRVAPICHGLRFKRIVHTHQRPDGATGDGHENRAGAVLTVFEACQDGTVDLNGSMTAQMPGETVQEQSAQVLA